MEEAPAPPAPARPLPNFPIAASGRLESALTVTPATSRPLPVLDDEPAGARVWVRPPHEGKVRFAVFLFACLLFLPHLGSFGLWDPWETHYGAVTTDMIETRDWVSPWWGYKEKIGDEAKQGGYFYSKPVFIFWTEGFFVNLLGRGEWAIRLPMAVLAILATLAAYLALSKIWSRRAGVLGAVVLATSPTFFMTSRQAQTDMPFVATLVLALAAFMLAFFGPRQPMTPRALRWRLLGTLGFVLVSVVPQYAILVTDLRDPPKGKLEGLASLVWTIQRTGWIHVAVYSLVLLATLLWFALDLRRDLRTEGLSERVADRWVRRAWLVVFYVLVAHATYAKGLLGFALPGLIILAWLLVSGAWRSLARAEIARGTLLALVVGLPWYVAMFCRHGMAYYQRFFIHDHFNRLATGVHQVDSGTFEHFIKWLGYGMFPWAVFVPIVLARFVRFEPRNLDGRAQGALFLGLWFALSFSLFTLSSTKFHHYIFPALPALALLVALLLDELLDDRGWLSRISVALGLLFFAAIAHDLLGDHQHLRNLMTYKYDRPYPDHLPIDPDLPVADGTNVTWRDSTFFRHTPASLQAILTAPILRYDTWMPILVVLGLVSLALAFAVRTRKAGLAGLGLMASLLAAWSLNYYLPALTPHWSQKYLFESYYDECTRARNPPEVDDAYTPLLARIGLGGLALSFSEGASWGGGKRVCEEDVISWRITWRGETHYSYNELQPITKSDVQFMPYLEERNGGKAFYVLMERGKMAGFKTKLEGYSEKLKRKKVEGWTTIDRWETEIVHDESLYFQMVRARPVRDAEVPADDT